MTTSITSLAQELGTLLLHKGWQVTCAESCTGGGIAAAITSVSGSSSWFGASIVTYSNHHKHCLLGVPEASLARYGAVSEQVVEAMALGALDFAEADLSVAVSGIAGPDGGSAEKPVGTVWIAWAGPGGADSRQYLFSGGRESVRQQTVAEALRGLIERCLKYTV